MARSPDSGSPLACKAVAFLTGCAALIYQVAWLRLLARPLGSNSLATAAVLGCFLLGLSLGAWAASRCSLVRRRPLTTFAAAEAAAGVWALGLPFTVPWIESILFQVPPSYAGAPLRILLAGAAVLPPTLAMGAAFPALAQASAARSTRGPGQETAAIYALNTLGAASGAFLATFFLLPWLGLLGAGHLAAGMDLVAATWAFLCAPSGRVSRLSPDSGRSAEPAASPRPAARRRLVYLVLFLSGAGTLGLEISWIRTLGLLFGTSAYARGIVVGLFVLGLGAGAWWAGFRSDRLRSSSGAASVLSGALILAALLAWAAHLAVPHLPPWIHAAVQLLSPRAGMVLVFDLLLCAGLLLPFTLVLGAAFPAALRVLIPSTEEVARGAGRAGAWNALGALAGALATALLFVPLLGLRGSLVWAGAGPLLLAGAAGSFLGRRRAPYLAAATLLAGVIWVGRWPPDRLAAAPYLYASRVTGEILMHQDGREVTTTVVHNPPWLELRINGKVDASTRRDLETQLFLGHLGALLHPNPRRVLVLGLGSGLTGAAVLAHPEVQDLTLLEIEPAVARAALYFRHWNRGVLSDPRTHLVLEDARSHLTGAEGPYDLVVSQPSNPWVAGMSDLFTRESFRASRRILAPGGVFVQWIQAYRLSPDDLRLMVRTFRDVFPDASLWVAGRALGDLALVGGEARMDVECLEDLLRAGGAASWDLRTMGLLRPPDLPARLLSTGEDLERLAGEGPLLTDLRPRLEYSAPLTLYDKEQYPAVLELLLAHRSRPSETFEELPDSVRARLGTLWYSRGRLLETLAVAPRLSATAYRRRLAAALAMDPQDADAARFLARAWTEEALRHLEQVREEEARKALDRALDVDPRLPRARLTRALLRERAGDLAGAASDYEAFVHVVPYEPTGWRRLAEVRSRLGDGVGERLALERALAVRPHLEGPLDHGSQPDPLRR